jgi:hypothetical protein
MRCMCGMLRQAGLIFIKIMQVKLISRKINGNDFNRRDIVSFDTKLLGESSLDCSPIETHHKVIKAIL